MTCPLDILRAARAEAKAAQERITLDMESGVILQLHKVAEAAHRLTKILAVGYMDTHATAAVVELRSAANFLEQTQKRYLDRMAEVDRAILLASQGEVK